MRRVADVLQDSDKLGAWMREQRWFGAKAADLSHFGVLDHVELQDGLGCALVEARFNSGVHDVYQLIVSGDDLDAEGGRTLVRMMQEQATAGGIRFHWTGAEPAPRGDASVRPMGAEQSNSTIVVGEALALKVFRRLLPGDNPELEMLRFLTAHGFENIAPLAGWYEFDGELLQATLGVLQRFVADGRDGWGYALAEPDAFLDQVRDLGSVTGEMHSVLASDHGDADFTPEEPGDDALGLLTATINEEIERAFFDLRDSDEAARPIMGRGEELRDQLRALSHQSSGGRLIRHHGDYHLGQTLLTPRGWVVLDFEGEPARTLPERRRKRSPLRDAAGMLRSFAYVASASDTLPVDWEERARASFLEGYYEAVDDVLLPAGRSAIDKLLAIHELEKAVYELRYELNNRPDWVGIPVSAIARLLDEPLD